jgi:hypothetical protein
MDSSHLESKIGFWRPVSIPQDFGPEYQVELMTKITLPIHLWWSGKPLVLDPTIEKDLVRLYELVLIEGGEKDIREYISFETLRMLWGQLFLPKYVRSQWDHWLTEHDISFD